MIDHIGLAVSNIERSKAFYSSALEPLGIGLLMEVTAEQTGADAHAGFGKDNKAFFWIGTGTKPKRAPRSIRSIARLWPPGDGTMARLARGPITTSIITAPSCLIPTATTSRRCATGRDSGPSCATSRAFIIGAHWPRRPRARQRRRGRSAMAMVSLKLRPVSRACRKPATP
jgi:hypothetical protein